MTAATAGPVARAARLWLPVRIDSRRPASWLTLLAAAMAAAAIPTAAIRNAELVAFVVGGLLAVAACGTPPRLAGMPPVARWIAVRTAWPLAGVALASAAVAAVDLRWMGPAAAALPAGIAVTAATIAAAARRGAGPADAASLAVMLVCGAGLSAAALITATDSADAAGGRGIVAALALWLLLAGTAAAAATSVDRGGQGFTASPVVSPAAGPLRLALLSLAMASSLAGMVACFFLAPTLAGWYPLLAGSWFASLAMPQAILLMGDADAAAWHRLLCSQGPSGLASRSIRTAASIGSLLGWPAAVAFVVRTAVPTAESAVVMQAAAVSIAGLLAGTAVVSLAGVVVRTGRPTRETALACVAGLFAAAVLVAAGLPGLPGLPR